MCIKVITKYPQPLDIYLVNSSVTESIMSSDKAFLVAGLARVIVSTPSSLVTLVKDAIPLLINDSHDL